MSPVYVVWMVACSAAAPAGAQEVDPLRPDQIDARIRRHRTAEATLTVTGPEGRPLANAAVTVRQVRHKFLFGCNAYALGQCGDPQLEQAYRRRFAELLNYATLPFYWGGYERQPGKTQRGRLGEMARWCAAGGIRTKGHPLCWHEVAPGWLRDSQPEEVEKLQMERIAREVKGFAGAIDTWDVVNEAVVMPRHEGGRNPIAQLCDRLGRVELIRRTFARARAANPRAVLLLNDFDTSPKYEALLRDCLKAGVPIDVIGIQSHMHRRYWGAKKAWDVCERFAKLGKPLHFTELTILSGKLKTDSDWHGHHPGWDSTPEGEKRQARQAAELYRLLFSHPAVEAITWWDFSDLRAWQGAPAGLVRKDMSPKPAYEALRKLVKGDWWTGEVKLTTDPAGRAAFRGFLGAYELNSAQGTATFELGSAGETAVSVRLRAPQRD